MNTQNENQHWVSQALLKRFKQDGAPLQCYQVESGEWVPKSLERVCAAPGYNQLLVAGTTDNTLEAAFSKVESGLPNTLRALEKASKRSRSELPGAQYDNLCWYCSFLSGVAPQAKPGAVVSFIYQLNMELEKGWNSLFKELDVPEATITELRRYHSAGYKVIVESENLLQLLFRIQFTRNLRFDYSQFLSTKWIVCRSPIEIPMSDVGLVPIVWQALRASHYLLPIGPNLFLDGMFEHDLTKNSQEPIVYGKELDQKQAQYRFDCICASAITELICRTKLRNIPQARSRAKEAGISFHKITDPRSIKVSGLADVGEGDLRFRIVSAEEYKQVVQSYMQPSD
jgi:Protein of unknown function (DUF4238)